MTATGCRSLRWLCYRCGVSLHDPSELILARGIEVSYRSHPLWTLRVGTEYAGD